MRTIQLPDSIGTTYVSALRAMPDGSVWVATSRGEAVKVRLHEVVRVVPLGQRLVQRILMQGDRLLFVTRTAVWRLPPGASTPTRQPFQYDIAPSKIETASGVGAGVFNADRGPDGTTWVIDGHLGPGRLHADGTVSFVGAPQKDPGDLWYTLRFAEDGTAFVLQGETLHRMDPTSGTLSSLFEDLGSPTYLSVQGSTAYATRGRTLLRYDGGAGRQLSSLGRQQGLPERVPEEVLRDRNGGLWIGTHEGLFYLPAPGARHLSAVEGTSLYNVSQFLSEERALWARTYGSGLIQLRPTRHRATPGGLTGWRGDIYAQDGRLHAISSKTASWFRWAEPSGWQHLAPTGGALKGVVAPNGTGFFLHDGGLFRQEPSAKASPVELVSWPDSLQYLHNIALTPKGALLHRAEKYIYHRRANGTIADTIGALPDHDRSKAEALRVNQFSNMRDMRVDADGSVWCAFSYDGGILRIDPASGQRRMILEDQSIWHIDVVGDSLVLASTRQNGLYLVDAREGKVRRHLTASDGLTSETVFAAHLSHDTLYVGHQNGITTLPAGGLWDVPESPKVLLTGWETGLDDRPLSADSIVEADERTVGFSYTGPSLSHARHVRYEVRLKPQRTNWETTERRFVRYRNLEPGTYRFEVRARLKGQPPGPVTTYSFSVPPHFYETWWFHLLVGLSLLGGGVGLYRWRTVRLRRRKEELEAAVAERTRELAEEKEKTERQAERLAELDEAKNRFFAHVSHEFRTPLSLLLGPLEEELRQGDGPVSFGRRQARRMADNARRLQRLINQLLDLATLEAGQMDLERQPGDLASAIERSAEAFRSKAEQKDIDLRVERPDGRIETRFDPEKVETIVSNLVGNAVKFTPEGGAVTVTVEEADAPASVEAPGADESVQGTVRLEVADTGPGIDPDVQEAIFDRFEQADHSTARAHEGTGLGLALTRELVELHGGTIDLDATPDEGSTFAVLLPLVPVAGVDEREHGGVGDGEYGSMGDGERGREARSEARTEAASVFEEGSSADAERDEDAATILVVEDNAEMRAYLQEQLVDPWTVLAAPDGRAAWKMVQAEAPDLVLSDVMMPGLNGFELCRRIKADEALRTIPVLLLTARADADATREGLSAGADDYVAKPFDAEELRQRIENHLAARRHLRNQYREELEIDAFEAVTEIEQRSFVETAIEAVEAHLGNPDFTVEQLAEAVALSRRQLTRRLKQAVGETPSSFIRQYRIERAKTLFENGAETVSEVAYATGFRSPSHFSQAFKEEVGTTPSGYQEEVVT
jgi:signal transduction histidine kinase/DNA-binding response OmpR family regulator